MATTASAGLPSLPHTNRKPNPRLKNSEDASKGIWSSMLDSVATSKRLAEKKVLVLGGTADSQKEFLEALAQESPAGGQQRRRAADRGGRRPPLANRFALGYTYLDVLDADHDDILARLSLYLLTDPHPSYTSLLTPLFTPQNVPNTLVVLLLSWEQPWTFLRSLRSWIRLLRHVLNNVDNSTKEAMDENMKEWTERRRGTANVATADGVPGGMDSGGGEENMGALPKGPGEWDEPLGVPITVVCQHAEQIPQLSQTHNWTDKEFDYILQMLRTVLLKHGGSLIYTATSRPGSLETLIKSELDVHSLLERKELRYEIVDRERILVPANWDSWGKIRVVGESFDCEGMSNEWSVEIQEAPRADEEDIADKQHTLEKAEANGEQQDGAASKSVVAHYESTIQDPNRSRQEAPGNTALKFGSTGPAGAASSSGAVLNGNSKGKPGIETDCQDTQDFLAGQSQVLEQLKAEDEQKKREQEAARKQGEGKSPTTAAPGVAFPSRDAGGKEEGSRNRLNEQIGPVQFNMGGIQVDADDALKSLREKKVSDGEGRRGISPSSAGSSAYTPETRPPPRAYTPNTFTAGAGEKEGEGSEGGEAENEKLKSFFSGLVSRGGGRSATASPKPGSPSPR